jgi:hypothetical protein
LTIAIKVDAHFLSSLEDLIHGRKRWFRRHPVSNMHLDGMGTEFRGIQKQSREDA